MYTANFNLFTFFSQNEKKKLGSALQNRVGRRPETNACFFFGLTHGFIDDDILFLAIYKKIAGKLPRLDYRNVTRRGNRREGEDGTQTGKGLTAVRCGLSAYTLHIRKQKTSLSNLPNLKQ